MRIIEQLAASPSGLERLQWSGAGQAVGAMLGNHYLEAVREAPHAEWLAGAERILVQGHRKDFYVKGLSVQGSDRQKYTDDMISFALGITRARMMVVAGDPARLRQVATEIVATADDWRVVELVNILLAELGQSEIAPEPTLREADLEGLR